MLKERKEQNKCVRRDQVVYLTYQNVSYLIVKEGVDASSVTFRKQQSKSMEPNQISQTSLFVQERQYILFDAIYGIITLSKKTYLILVTQSHQVGQIKNKQIYKVDQVEFVQIGSEEQEDIFQKHLKQSFNLFNFYFSTYNLTQRIQFSYQNPHYYEHSYFSNYLYTLEYQKYPFELLTKFIIGYVQTKSVQSQNITYHQTIISRANFNNLGRRWLRRGLNKNAYAANSFQIEYIIQINTQSAQNLYSYLQLRGSIPLQWSQTADFKLKPKTGVNQDEETNAILFKQYMLRQQKLERNVHIINLLGRINTEGFLSKLFQSHYNNLKLEATFFTSWDYQKKHKCKGKKAFEQLVSDLGEQIMNFSFFKVVIRKEEFDDIVESTQKGTFRTNCLDSVDRTNYVQMLFAKIFALNVFRDFRKLQGNIINPYIALPSAKLQSDLKSIWINSGNQISYQNSGTQLMKLDFYDNGNRTVWGLFRDFTVGFRRHIYGHFIDYYMQNCMDLHFKKVNMNQGETKFQGSSLKRLFSFLSLTTLFLMPFISWKAVSSQIQQPIKKYILSGMSSISSTITFYMLIRRYGQSLLNKSINNVEYC